MGILSKYDLFIFDWDHTLTTSTRLVTLLRILDSWRSVGRAKGIRREYAPGNAIKEVKISEDVSKLYAILDNLYTYVSRPKLKDNTVPLLSYLKQRRKKVAIFSDSKTYRLMKETRLLGIMKHVDYALSAEAIGFYKPNPTGLLLIADKFGTKRAKALYVGDMATDILTAKFAGVGSCAVSNGVDSRERLRDAKPDYLFGNLREFMRAAKK